MIDAPPAPASLLNKIKEAMGTYEPHLMGVEIWAVAKFGLTVEVGLAASEARNRALDLNARAVIDAILSWEPEVGAG